MATPFQWIRKLRIDRSLGGCVGQCVVPTEPACACNETSKQHNNKPDAARRRAGHNIAFSPICLELLVTKEEAVESCPGNADNEHSMKLVPEYW